jgi:hypothetical protein
MSATKGNSEAIHHNGSKRFCSAHKSKIKVLALAKRASLGDKESRKFPLLTDDTMRWRESAHFIKRQHIAPSQRKYLFVRVLHAPISK